MKGEGGKKLFGAPPSLQSPLKLRTSSDVADYVRRSRMSKKASAGNTGC